jgi:hypothetical protein
MFTRCLIVVTLSPPPPPPPPSIVVINRRGAIYINSWAERSDVRTRLSQSVDLSSIYQSRFIVNLSKMIAEAGFSAVVEPSLETGRILDAPLWGMMAEFGNGCL